MSKNDRIQETDRRRFTKALGVGALAGLAGCAGQPPDDSTPTPTSGSGGGDDSGSDDGGDAETEAGVIANLNPLSGGAAVGGKAIQKGVKLRFEELEEAGGIDGVMPERLYENDKCSADTSVGVLQELVSQHPNLSTYIGGYCSPTTLSTMQTTRNEEILQVVTSAAPAVTEQDHPYVFRVFPSSTQSVPIAVDYALGELGAETVSILGINNAWGKAQTEMWRKLINQSNQAEVVSFDQVPLSKQDYSNEVNKIRAEKPDVIYALGYHGQTVGMLKQIEDFGMTVGEDVDVFIASIAGLILNSIAGNETLANVHAPLIFVGPAFADFPNSAPDYMANFVEKWNEAYDEPAIRESATGYALAETAVQGMQRAGTTTNVSKIAEALHDLDEPFETPLGPISFESSGQARLEVFIGQYNSDGKLVRRTEPRYADEL